MRAQNVDVLIAGGGIVGCAMALALSKATGLSIAIVERYPPDKSDTHPSFDARVIALANASLAILNKWGFDTKNIKGGDIKRIHVSDRKHVGQVLLDAKDASVPYLGKVVQLERIGFDLYEALKNTQVNYYSPESIQRLERTAEKVTAYTEARKIESKLLIICEGGMSSTRDLVNIKTSHKDYEQSAVICNLHTQLAHQNCAYERFTKYGPVALLPMQEAHLMSVVWTTTHEHAKRLKGLGDDAFLQELQALFGNRLGKLSNNTARFYYPLGLTQVKDFVSHRCVCVGNAAQSLHPIAGQGFNLGLRDIDDLTQVLKRAFITHHGGQEQKPDVGAFKILNAYKQARQADKSAVVNATNMLVHTFSNQYEPLVLGRNISLIGLNFASSLKNRFANKAMGYR